jgi:hypothetical protein
MNALITSNGAGSTVSTQPAQYNFRDAGDETEVEDMTFLQALKILARLIGGEVVVR